MFFFFIIGMRLFTWGSEMSGQQLRCSNCGAVGGFIAKKGMRFITLFFIVPVLPISGVKHILQCSTCAARFNAV